MEKFLQFDPQKPAQNLLIWLHGLGANGDDFSFLSSIPPFKDSWRIILPNANRLPVTVNLGLFMPAWYDIESADLDKQNDYQGLQQSVLKISNIITTQRQQQKFTKIVVGGFSQGAAVALWTALTYPQALSGAISLAGYLPWTDKISPLLQQINQNMPILISHGYNDNIVSLKLAENCYHFLNNNQYKIDLQRYDVDHTISETQLLKLCHWVDSDKLLNL